MLVTLNYDFSGRYDFLSSSNSSQANAEWAKTSSLFQELESAATHAENEVEIRIAPRYVKDMETSGVHTSDKALDESPPRSVRSEFYRADSRSEQAIKMLYRKESGRFTVNYVDVVEYDYERVVRMQYAQVQFDKKNTQEFSRKNQWLAGGSAGPQSANAFVKPPNESTINSFSPENINHTNTSLVNGTLDNALAINVNVGKAVTNRVEVYSGIGYNRFIGTQTSHYQGIEEITEITYEPVEGGYRKIVNKREAPLTDTVRANYTAHLIEVPLSLRYHIGSNRLSYFLSGGMSASLASGYSASYTSTAAEGGNSYSSGLGVQAYSFNLGIGLQYGLNKNLMLRLEPTYRHAIPTAENAIFYDNLNSIGVLTGIFFFFE